MKPLIVSFSGGRTSAFMAKFLQSHYPKREIHYIFCNTGLEKEETLEFVLKCDKEWDLRVQWIEANVHQEKGIATTHNVVDFESASRQGEPMEAVIAKYGLPNMSYLHCTRETKIQVAKSYVENELGLTDYEMAIGIRADEAHRRPKTSGKLVYPFLDIYPVIEAMVRFFWAKQSFDLKLKYNYEGNCKLCHKKSIKKLILQIKDELKNYNPSEFNVIDYWLKMEKLYSMVGSKNGMPRYLFRGNRTMADLLELADRPTLFDDEDFEVERECFCPAV